MHRQRHQHRQRAMWRAEFEASAEKALQSLQKALEASRAGCEPFALYEPLRAAVGALQAADEVAAEAATDAELEALETAKKSGLRP